MTSNVTVPLDITVLQGHTFDPNESQQLRINASTSFGGVVKVLVAPPEAVPMGRVEVLEKQLAESVRLHQKTDAKLQYAQKELAALDNEVQQRRKRENDLSGKVVILTSQNNNLKSELQALADEAKREQVAHAQTQAALANAIEERDKIEQQLQVVSGQLDASRAQVARMQQEARNTVNLCREYESAYQTKERQYNELADLNRKLNESLALANGARDHVQRRLTNAVNSHEKTIAALEEEAAEALHRARRPEETVVTFIVKAIKQRYSQQPQFAAPLVHRPVDVAADIRAIVRDELQRVEADDGK